jgi:tetratricopeptide (TPR) repeat protein
MTLFTTDSKINNNYDIQNNIGSEYFNKGEYQQALKHFKASEKMLPYEVNTYNIGITYHVLQNVENAKEAYLKVINQKHFLIDRQYRYVSYIKLAEVLSYSSKPTPESLEIIKKGTVDYSNAGLLWAALSYNYRVLGIENEESKKAVENAYKYLPQDKVPAFEKLMKQ